jgi:hypothetical protein
MLVRSRLRLFGVFCCLIVIHAVLFAQSTPAASTQVQVTFYSSGSFLKGYIPGYKHAKFNGRIMDGHKPSTSIPASIR